MGKILFCLLLACTGCATTAPKYTDLEIKEKEVSIIRNKKVAFNFFSTREFKAIIEAVYKNNGDTVYKKSLLWPGIEKINIEPGSYIFFVRCQSGDIYSLPKVIKQIEPNKSYDIFCEISKKGKFLGMETVEKVMAKIEEASK